MAEVVRQCPTCGSPAVDFSSLVDGAASCRVCGWKGTNDELLSTPFEHLLGTSEGIGFELMNDTRRLLSSPVFLGELGGFLNRWGFINVNDPHKKVVRATTKYVAAIARAVLTAVIQTREELEKEHMHVSRRS